MYGQHTHTDNLRLCGQYNATDRLAIHAAIVCTQRKAFYCLQIDHGIPTQGGSMKNTFLDYLAAIAIGLMLCIGALHYFDVLVK
jgi:hypothetical protein